MKFKETLILIIFLSLTITLVSLFYFHTLFYPVKAFDEITPFKETFLPVCFSFTEILELISRLGLKQHFEASNTLYSNIVSFRCNPFGNLVQLLVQLVFQKKIFIYRLYGLTLHIFNTILVFLILNKTTAYLPKIPFKIKLSIISIITLLWATHPVNIESVLLLINANVVLSHFFSLMAIFIYLNLMTSNQNLLKQFFLFIVFLFALFTAEFHFMLPLILIALTTAINISINQKSLMQSLLFSTKTAMPLIVAGLIFIITFLISNTKINVTSQISPVLLFERIFWLAPQIIFHLLSLLLFPIKLSVDQSLLVTLGKSIFDPYVVFCFFFVVMLLILSFISYIFGQTHGSAPTPLISFANAKKKFPFLFIIIFPVLLSLVPFSHILAPVYNLASERYLYFPSFILIFGMAFFIFYLISKFQNNKIVITLIFLLLILTLVTYSARAYIRTLDWKDTISLYQSAINTTNNPLAKAFRLKLLTPTDKIFSKYSHREVEINYQKLAIKKLKQAIALYKGKIKTQQTITPEIIKSYGLDPVSLYAKAGYLLSHSDYTLNDNPQKALEIIQPFVKDLSVLDSQALSFYASLLFFNNKLDESESVYKFAYKKYPYITRIIFPLCQLVYIRRGDLNEVEDYSLNAFKYFPYDTFTLLYLIKLYKLKDDVERCAFFSYVYGIRHHSIDSLENARKLYLIQNKKDMVEKAGERIIFLEKKLNVKRAT